MAAVAGLVGGCGQRNHAGLLRHQGAIDLPGLGLSGLDLSGCGPCAFVAHGNVGHAFAVLVLRRQD